MKHIASIVIFVITIQLSAIGRMEAYSQHLYDTLELRLEQFILPDTLRTVNVPAEPKYNVEFQYPLYEIFINQNPGNKYRLRLASLPRQGYLYFFLLNHFNEIEIDTSVNVNELAQNVSDSLQLPAHNIEGNSYYIIWYTTQPLNNYNRMIKGIEMTRGDIASRMIAQIGKYLWTPDNHWHFTKKQMGLVFNQSVAETDPLKIIPIIIEIKTTKK